YLQTCRDRDPYRHHAAGLGGRARHELEDDDGVLVPHLGVPCDDLGEVPPDRLPITTADPGTTRVTLLAWLSNTAETLVVLSVAIADDVDGASPRPRGAACGELPAARQRRCRPG